MQIWAESGKSALPICNYSQILYQFLTFTQNLKRSQNSSNTVFRLGNIVESVLSIYSLEQNCSFEIVSMLCFLLDF